jgi:hypothetical protein
MAIKRAAGAVIGRPRFLGDGHLSPYFVYLSVQYSVSQSFDDDFR